MDYIDFVAKHFDISYKEIKVNPIPRGYKKFFTRSRKQKLCYNNSFNAISLLINEFPKAKYVIGIFDSVIPIDHSWIWLNNEIGYLDPTAELALELNVIKIRYWSIFELSFRDLVDVASHLKYPPALCDIKRYEASVKKLNY